MEESPAMRYCFVVRESVVLAEYAPFSGNFATIGLQCLEKLSADNRMSITCDGHTFNFIRDGLYAFLVVAVESVERKTIFAFLEKVREEFQSRYVATGRAESARAHGLDREFAPRLKEWMASPESLNKVAQVKEQIEDVKNVMITNIERVLEHQAKLEVVFKKAAQLQDNATVFRNEGVRLRRRLWLQNIKVKLLVFFIIVFIILLLWLAICRGFKCK
ncbi:hypothetical protein CBR_g31196 [Chara braunii]|uniref:V-SNARE coiled-coil homology domain-containing protein n=1 Tax=Chara braunii TaxID=69332 RepID=A0A388JXM1_CHABU|nr:hypothetical protein CBR_g31196 [Chara braunii]|eukprot:GBG62559.1 hypothetical protein CBR_g31196 [Chara braunii]